MTLQRLFFPTCKSIAFQPSSVTPRINCRVAIRAGFTQGEIFILSIDISRPRYFAMYFSSVRHNSRLVRRSCCCAAEPSWVHALSRIVSRKRYDFLSFIRWKSSNIGCDLHSEIFFLTKINRELFVERFAWRKVYTRIILFFQDTQLREMHPSYTALYAFRLTLNQVRRIKHQEFVSHGSCL